MKQNKYTIIWLDEYYRNYIDRISAENEEKALQQWLKKFKNRTIGYGFTHDECYYITRKMEDESPPYKVSYDTEKPYQNIFATSFLTNPNARTWDAPLIYLIKNKLDNNLKKERIFTFILYYYTKIGYVTQQKASSVHIAFLQWKLEMLKKKSYHEMPKRIAENFKYIMAREPHPPSQIVRHPGTWRWRFNIDIDHVTLYIVETESELSASLPNTSN